MLYLSGLPKTVSCIRFSTNLQFAPQENVAMANIQMEGGHLSHLCASFANDDHAGDAWTCMIKVLGTEGSTRYSYRDWVINERNGPHSQTYFCYPQTIKNTVDHFIEKVILQEQDPLSTLEDAITCQKVVEACEQSSNEGRHIML
jgi:predicted dehydrogenase